MKKTTRITALVITAVMLCGIFAVPSAAKEMFFTSSPIPAPEFALSINDADNISTLIKAVTVTPEALLELASSFRKSPQQFHSDYNSVFFKTYLQFDWRIGDGDDWKYHEAWDSSTVDYGDRPMICNIDPFVSLNSAEVINLESTEMAERFEQCVTTLEYNNSVVNKTLNKLDYTNFNIYLRARYFVIFMLDGDDEEYCAFSDWSAEQLIAPPDKSLLSDLSLERPVIQNLDITYPDETIDVKTPNVSFDLMLNDNIKRAIIVLKALYGYSFTPELYVEMNGNSDRVYTLSENTAASDYGKRVFKLDSAIDTDNIKLAVRVRLSCMKNMIEDTLEQDIMTSWSDIAEYTAGNWQQAESKAAEEVTVVEDENTIHSSSCALCHNCGAPLGICVIIWVILGVILLLVINFVVLWLINRFRDDDNFFAPQQLFIFRKKKKKHKHRSSGNSKHHSSSSKHHSSNSKHHNSNSKHHNSNSEHHSSGEKEIVTDIEENGSSFGTVPAIAVEDEQKPAETDIEKPEAKAEGETDSGASGLTIETLTKAAIEALEKDKSSDGEPPQA